MVQARCREVRALRIHEGATEVQQLMVARETLKEYRARHAAP